MNHNKTQKYVKLLQVVVVVISVYLILKYLLPLVLPFVIAFFLYRLFYPWAEKLAHKTHIPVTLWSCVFVVGFAIIMFTAIFGVIYYVYGQIQIFLENEDAIRMWMDTILSRICEKAADMTGTNKTVVEHWFYTKGQVFLENMQTNLPEKVASFCITSVKCLGKALIVFFIALVATVLLMKNKRRISGQINKNMFAKEITGVVTRVCEVSVGFFKCQAIIISIIAVVLAIGLRLMGNAYGILIGIALAFLDALPVIGSGTVLLPWALFSLLMGHYKNAVILVVLYGICTIIREVLEPRLMGDKLGINEFYMLMATFIGITLFGVWGIFLGPLGMIMILEILKQMEDLYLEDNSDVIT